MIRDSKKKHESYSISFLLNISSTNRDPSKFQGVCMDDIPYVEDRVRINLFIYDIDLIDVAMVGEHARRSIKKYEKKVQLIRYDSHICYVDNIHALCKVFRCATFGTYFQKTGNLERHLVRCSERVKHIYPNNAYQLQETLFDKLDSFDIQYTDDQTLFHNLAVFEFESICTPEIKFKNTETTSWIGKHVTRSVSLSWNLIAMPIFLCKSSPRNSVESLIDAVEVLATQSKTQMKLNFLEVETANISKLTQTLESLNEHRCRNQRVFEFEDQFFEDDNEKKDASTQFFQLQKNKLIERQEHLERYCNVLPVSEFISAIFDINLIKSYLLPFLMNERNMEPTVIKKPSNMCLLNLVMLSVSVLWIFSVEQQALTRFLLKLIRQQKLKFSFPMNGSTVYKRWITVNFLLTMPFSAKFETWTPWKRTIQIINNYSAADWRLKKHYLKRSFPNHRLQEKKTPNFVWHMESWEIMRNHLKTFYAGATTKTLSQHWKQFKKCLFSITRKELTCWTSGVHFRIWQIFVSANVPVPTSIHLLKPIKICCKRFEKICLLVLLSFSHVKL